MTRTLNVLSLLSIVLGVFWSTYAVANGYRSIWGDPSYFLPQAVMFLAVGVAFWAIFGTLSRVLTTVEKVVQKLESSQPTTD